MVVALIALAVTFSLSAAMLRRAALQHREIQRREWMIQAEWLANSGVTRALAKRRADPKYTEESWDVSAADIGGSDAGRVAIVIKPEDNAPERITLDVTADYPDRPHDRARSHRTLTLTLPASE
jgi:hypothetical protein